MLWATLALSEIAPFTTLFPSNVVLIVHETQTCFQQNPVFTTLFCENRFYCRSILHVIFMRLWTVYGDISTLPFSVNLITSFYDRKSVTCSSVMPENVNVSENCSSSELTVNIATIFTSIFYPYLYASFTPCESKSDFFLWSLTSFSVNSWTENNSTYFLAMSLSRSLVWTNP